MKEYEVIFRFKIRSESKADAEETKSTIIELAHMDELGEYVDGFVEYNSDLKELPSNP